MHSTVRGSAHIGFSGGSYGEAFVLADVRLCGGVPDAEVILYFSPAGMVVVAPLPGGLHRIVAPVAEAPEQPGAARVLLVGDAAHVHSPAGGQGMNAGTLDAMSLAGALNKALAGDTLALDAYGAERRPVAKKVIALADRLTRLASVRPALRAWRNLLLSTLRRRPCRHLLYPQQADYPGSHVFVCSGGTVPGSGNAAAG